METGPPIHPPYAYTAGPAPTPSSFHTTSDYIAQNGIQIGFMAGGIVVGNTVAGNSYSASSNTENYLTATYMAGGILIYDASQAVISDNTVSGNDIGIWVANYGAPNPAILVKGNIVDNSYGYGIVFDSVNGRAIGNQVSNSPVGLMATTFMDYNMTVHSVSNSFTNVPTDTQTLEPNPPYQAIIVQEGRLIIFI